MSDHQIYRFVETRTVAALSKVRLQRRIRLGFWVTVDSQIPLPPPNASVEQLEEAARQAKAALWVRRRAYLVREYRLLGRPAPTMILETPENLR